MFSDTDSEEEVEDRKEKVEGMKLMSESTGAVEEGGEGSVHVFDDVVMIVSWGCLCDVGRWPTSCIDYCCIVCKETRETIPEEREDCRTRITSHRKSRRKCE